MPAEDDTNPGSVTLAHIFSQGAETQRCVKKNTDKIACVEGKIDTHLTEHGVTKSVKERLLKNAGTIIKLIIGVLTILGIMWTVANYFKVDPEELAAKVAKYNNGYKHGPVVEYGGEEDPE